MASLVVSGRGVAGWGMEEEENDEEGRHRRGRQGSGAGDRGGGPGQPILRRRRQWSRRCCGQPAREVSWSLRKPPALDALPIPLIHNPAAELHHAAASFARQVLFLATAGHLRKGKLMRHGSGMHSAGDSGQSIPLDSIRYRMQTEKATNYSLCGCIGRFRSSGNEISNSTQRLDEPTPPRSLPAPCSSALCADRQVMQPCNLDQPSIASRTQHGKSISPGQAWLDSWTPES